MAWACASTRPWRWLALRGCGASRRRSDEVDGSFLVQSFVREMRVLGVQSARDMEADEKKESEVMENAQKEEEGGALAKVTIPIRSTMP